MTAVWAVIAVMFATIFYLSFLVQNINYSITPLQSGIFLSLARLAWPIMVSLLIFACIKGYGGPVNTFLASPLWQPLARVSYTLYIVHMPLLLVFTASARRSVYFSESNVVSTRCERTT